MNSFKDHLKEYFNVGDMVEVESQYDSHFGKRGIVKRASNGSATVLIDLGSRKTMVSYNSSDLKLVK